MKGTGRAPFVDPRIAGVVAAVVIAGIVLVMGWINVNFAAPWARTHTVTAQISDADGIAVSSDVRIAGRLVGQVDGGNGHSGKRSPDLHFGLGRAGAGPFRVELRWRDPGGNVQEHTLSLPPGWHTVLLGWPVPKER